MNETKISLGMIVTGTLILGLVLASIGCSYCKQVANVNTGICKAERTIVQCGPKAVGVVAEIIPLLIAQEWEQAMAVIGTEAPEEAECIKDELQNMLSKKFGADSPQLKSFKAVRAARAKMGLK